MKIRVQLFVLVSTMLVTLLGAPTQARAIMPPDDYYYCAIPESWMCGPQSTSCESELRQQGLFVEGYACNTFVSSLSYYKGWGNIRSGGACSAPLRVNAWRWNGAWSKTYLDQNTRVYIWPFAVDWSWVWTQGTGWLAVRDANLVINKWESPYRLMLACAQPAGYSYVD